MSKLKTSKEVSVALCGVLACMKVMMTEGSVSKLSQNWEVMSRPSG